MLVSVFILVFITSESLTLFTYSTMRGELDINENVSPRKVIQSASDMLYKMSPNPATFILCTYLSKNFKFKKVRLSAANKSNCSLR